MEEKRNYRIIPDKNFGMYDTCFCTNNNCKTLCARNINLFNPREKYFTAADFSSSCSSYSADEPVDK